MHRKGHLALADLKVEVHGLRDVVQLFQVREDFTEDKSDLLGKVMFVVGKNGWKSVETIFDKILALTDKGVIALVKFID